MAEDKIVVSINGSNYPFIDTSYPAGSTVDFSNLLNLTTQDKFVPSTATAAAGLLAEKGGNASALNALFASYNLGNNPLPTTWDAFVKSLRGTNSTNVNSGAVWNAFVSNYKAIVDASGDFSILNISNADLERQFQNSFDKFLQTYPYKSGNVVGTPSEFMDNWTKYMTLTSSLQTGGNTNATGLASFQMVFEAYGFPPSEFQSKLTSFYNSILKQTGGPASTSTGADLKGYFIPSQVFHQWIESVQQEYITGSQLSTVITPDSKRTMVVDRVIRLLIAMIDVLQKITASQAERLTFLTNWQQVYTNALVDIPIFTRGDGSAIDGNPTPTEVQASGLSLKDLQKNEDKMRREVNPKMQALQEKVRARRSQISDTAKGLQSNINQSQEAANQQTEIATALLQQMSAILSAIYR